MSYIRKPYGPKGHVKGPYFLGTSKSRYGKVRLPGGICKIPHPLPTIYGKQLFFFAYKMAPPFVLNGLEMGVILTTTLPETNSEFSPENGWLEY